LIQPEQCIRQQEVANLGPPIIENHRAPVGMLALLGVVVLVAGGAVETAQAMTVAGKMSRHPVKDDADVVPVAIVNEVGKVLGSAVAAGDREIAHCLIAPRTRIRM